MSGVANTTIATQLGVSRPTVLLWRNRYVAGGIAALDDQPRSAAGQRGCSPTSWGSRSPRWRGSGGSGSCSRGGPITPTSGSWLNLVEILFGIITRQAIRRGTFNTPRTLLRCLGTSFARVSRHRPAARYTLACEEPLKILLAAPTEEPFFLGGSRRRRDPALVYVALAQIAYETTVVE